MEIVVLILVIALALYLLQMLPVDSQLMQILRVVIIVVALIWLMRILGFAL